MTSAGAGHLPKALAYTPVMAGLTSRAVIHVLLSLKKTVHYICIYNPHARTTTYIHTYTPTHTRTPTRTHTLRHVYVHKCVCVFAPVYTYVYVCAYDI